MLGVVFSQWFFINRDPTGFSPSSAGRSVQVQFSSPKYWRRKLPSSQNSSRSRDTCCRGSVTILSPLTLPASSNSKVRIIGNSNTVVPAYILISGLLSSARASYSSSSSYSKYTSLSPRESGLHFLNAVKPGSGMDGGPPLVPQA